MRRLKPLLLLIWRDVPFPEWLRHVFLRLLNPSWMVGVMGLVQDDDGRILVLEHTYRHVRPWGLPGGWLKRGEAPYEGLAREIMEETGLTVRVEELLGAEINQPRVLDLIYRCRVLSGTYGPTAETRRARWVAPSELPPLLIPQERMLQQVGIVPDPRAASDEP